MNDTVKTDIIDEITGTALPLPGDDIDTDRIMPARYLKELTFENLGQYVFHDEIQAAKDSANPHGFANTDYSNANFLIVNSNFGCGSSREHAPQGIKRWGVDCIIGESFSEIFYSNCCSIGLPCLHVSSEIAKELQEIASKQPDINFELSLSKQQLRVGEKEYDFSMSEGDREAFVAGKWDMLSELLSRKVEIASLLDELPY